MCNLTFVNSFVQKTKALHWRFCTNKLMLKHKEKNKRGSLNFPSLFTQEECIQ